VLKALLLHGAKVNENGGQYDTALYTIATVGNANIAKILLEAGADVVLRDRHNCTALQVAVAALRVAMGRYQTWRSKNLIPRNPTAIPSWVGPCCALAQEDSELLAEPRVMRSWPSLTLDVVTLGYAPWNWDDIKSRMTFRADSDFDLCPKEPHRKAGECKSALS
jgi:hypothetical protein